MTMFYLMCDDDCTTAPIVALPYEVKNKRTHIKGIIGTLNAKSCKSLSLNFGYWMQNEINELEDTWKTWHWCAYYGKLNKTLINTIA